MKIKTALSLRQFTFLSYFALNVMLNETIRNDDFFRNTALQHGYNIVPALQRCVALKIVVANRPV